MMLLSLGCFVSQRLWLPHCWLRLRFVFPLAYYAGQAVTALVFSSLVLHYGARAVRDAGITELDDDWEASE